MLAATAALSSVAAGPIALAGPAAHAAPAAGAERPSPVVGIAHCLLVDESRTTFDYANGETLPGRRLAIEIRYPARRAGVSYPTIFFAPGFDVTPDTYAALLDSWVRSGFVVVGLTFPDTDPSGVAAAKVGDAEDDVVNQPADMAFVVRTLVQATRETNPACRIVRGLIDPTEIGLAGQSDGGETVAMQAYDRSEGYADLDDGLGIRAVAVMSGAEIGDGPYEAVPGDPALLVVQSATDQCNPPQESTELYDSIVQRDRWFLDIHRADHLPPYDGADPAAFAVVARVTARFFLLELSGRQPAAGFLEYGDADPDVATLTSGASAPPIAPLPGLESACYLA